jgi:hypothetical protein
MDGELTLESVRKRIEERGAKWIAGETSLSQLSLEDVKRRFGVAPKEEITWELPAQFDWRSNPGNWMTPVKNQGNCSSCVAFGTISALEALLKIHYYNDPSKIIDLSEAYLWACGRGTGEPKRASCSTDTWIPTGDYGSCKYLQGYGVPLDANCPYPTSPTSTTIIECSSGCLSCSISEHTRIKSFSEIGNRSTDDIIKRSLCKNGPLVVVYQAGADIKHYKGGIYRPITDPLYDHCAALVGYDSQGWILKDSFGTSWGENGYVRIGYGYLKTIVEMKVFKPRLRISFKMGGEPITNCWLLILNILRDGNSLIDGDPTVLPILQERFDGIARVMNYQNQIHIDTRPIHKGDYIDLNNFLVSVPPGNYTLNAHVCLAGNHSTDTATVTVPACHIDDNEISVTINLSSDKQCASEILYPFALQAIKRRQPLDDVKVAIKALLTMAEMSKDDFIEELERWMDELGKADRCGIDEATGHLSATETILELVRSIED